MKLTTILVYYNLNLLARVDGYVPGNFLQEVFTCVVDSNENNYRLLNEVYEALNADPTWVGVPRSASVGDVIVLVRELKPTAYAIGEAEWRPLDWYPDPDSWCPNCGDLMSSHHPTHPCSFDPDVAWPRKEG